MRSAKATEVFPYNLSTMCYILVSSSGSVEQITHTTPEYTKAYNAVKSGTGSLYAVWPGNWRSDLFIIDDIERFGDAVGVVRSRSRRCLPDVVNWEFSKLDKPRENYALVDIFFSPEYNVVDIICNHGIRSIAADLEEQMGWDVATSKGSSGGSEKLTLSILRSSL